MPAPTTISPAIKMAGAACDQLPRWHHQCLVFSNSRVECLICQQIQQQLLVGPNPGRIIQIENQNERYLGSGQFPFVQA